MTAPVVGSGSCPAWMQRVEKSSWFFCDIQASHSAVILRVSRRVGWAKSLAEMRQDWSCTTSDFAHANKTRGHCASDMVTGRPNEILQCPPYGVTVQSENS